MVNEEDIIDVDVSQRELGGCKAAINAATGTLFDVLGGLVAAKALGMSAEAYFEQLDAASEFGVGLLYDNGSRFPCGVRGSLSTVYDTYVCDKSMIVPAGKLTGSAELGNHFTVAVFACCDKSNYVVDRVHWARAAGWLPAAEIRGWLKRSADGAFSAPGRLAVIPCSALYPMHRLVTELGADGIEL